MKRINIIITILCVSALLGACKKDGVRELPTTSVDGKASLKFFNFGVNSPSINFFVNDSKITAIASATGAESITGLAYGGVFPATNYCLLSPATYTFKGITPDLAATDPKVVVATIPGTLEGNKSYSLYTCGIYNTTTKTTDAFVVEDKIPAVNPAGASIRFINTISNAPSGFDLVIKNTITLIEYPVAKNVIYKTGSDFVLVPSGVYEVYARYPNSSVNVIVRNGTSTVSLVTGQAYSISSRGDMTVTGAAAANRPFLDNTSNRP